MKGKHMQNINSLHAFAPDFTFSSERSGNQPKDTSTKTSL